jgi:hypothetical protein
MNGVRTDAATLGYGTDRRAVAQKPDIYKGSYYANPLVDHPDVSDELREKNFM